MLYLTLRFVHLAFITLWFGSGLTTSSDVRRTLASPSPDLEGLRARMRHHARLGMLGGFGTLATGLGLIAYMGGFAMVPRAIHIALLLTIVLIGIGIGIGAAFRRLDAARGQGDAAVAAAMWRLRIINVAFHIIWTANLALMVFRHHIPV